VNNGVDRRESIRKEFQTPEVGAIYGFREVASLDSQLEDSSFGIYVDVLNISEGGAAASIETSIQLEPDSLANFIFVNSSDNQWETVQVRVVWTDDSSSKNLYRAGFQFIYKLSKGAGIRHASARVNWPQPNDISFLMDTRLIRFIPRQAICPLLNCLSLKKTEQGERLITQGEMGNNLYIIQDGSCTVNVKKDGKTHTVARLQRGDVVGEMAVLTSEPRSANVDADTGLKLWELDGKHFEIIASKHPDLRGFLTEIVTNRLESTQHTVERKIGKYLIQYKIDQGGYSIVYKGVHQVLKLPVVIKMMKHSMALEEDFIEKFRKEAETIASLNHINIVKVYDIEEVYRTIFIIMEYLEGESVESLLKRMGAIPIPQTVNFLTQICSALSYAHNRGLVHLDIKPANIFVPKESDIKILDFGLARPPEVEEGSIFEGTIQYLSPEQIECDPVDQRTDIYSLGLTAYEMIIGKRPYPEGNPPKLLKLHVNQDIPDPAGLVSELPDKLRRFILKACQRDPNRRYQDIGEALEDLRPLALELGQEMRATEFTSRKMTSLNLIYRDGQQMELNRLLEKFISEVQSLGVNIRAADFKDI
jgi:CRP-like cAMP-binding protein